MPSLLRQAQATPPPAAPAAAKPHGIQPAVAPAPKAQLDAAAVANEQARIAFEEKIARVKRLIPPGFAEACERVRGFQRGYPKLAGQAAIAHFAVTGQEMPAGARSPGSGEIANIELTDPAQMTQLADELAAEAAQRPVSPLSPDAPASDPALAAQQDAAPVNPIETVVSSAPAETVTVEAPPAKARGRKKAAPAAQTTSEPTGADENETLTILVDCTTTEQSTPLVDWAYALADKIAKHFGAEDVRCGALESPLGYDKWIGVITSWVRDPKLAPLPGGTYTLETRYSRLLQVVADALYQRVRAEGGIYVRGMR